MAAIYRQSALSPTSNSLLHDSLSNTIYNSRIPQGIKNASPVAHKTGTMDGVYNDAAIVHLDSNPFVLVILSRDASIEVVPMMRKLAMDVYNSHLIRAESGLAENMAELKTWLDR